MSFDLPELSRLALRRRGIAVEVDAVVAFVVDCLHEACALVAEDTGSERFDDRTSKGFLRWRRARNIIVERIAEQGPPGATAADIENALQIRIAGYALSFYSARDGIGQPDLSGSSKTKRTLVDEMQLQIDGVDAEPGPLRLAVLYEADAAGLVSVAVGVLANAHEWHWRVTAYNRGEGGQGARRAGNRPQPSHPSYDQQRVSDRPPLRKKKRQDEKHDES